VRWRGLAAVVALVALTFGGVAAAHEVRPALLQIAQIAPGDYDVTWKQPTVGDMAVHLAPQLSSGALAGPPRAEYAEAGFLIRTWSIRHGAPLDGQTVSVEGLPQSVTDVLVRVATPDGQAHDSVLRPAQPSQVLSLSPPRGIAVPGYLRLGVEHILTGFDHLLFVLGLLLLIGPNWRVVKAISAFTVAHSITLALAALGYVRFPSAAIEAMVALSIVFVACELAPGAHPEDTLTRRKPWLIAFAFGLLHGLAFAGALAEIGLPPKATPQALFLFNVGVELGQLMFIAAAILAMRLLDLLVRRLDWRPGRLAEAAPAYAIGGLAAYWLIERTVAAI
jgi:hydrogenase/urease accessory protein HupE